jgi:hypothetical protein
VQLHRALLFWKGCLWSAVAEPPHSKTKMPGSEGGRYNCNVSADGGAGDSLLEEAFQFFGVAGGREAGVSGADEGAGFVFGEMRQRLTQGDGKIFERGAWCYAKDGFAEVEDAVRSAFELFRGGVTFRAGDDHLCWVFGEEDCGEAVGCGEEAVLWCDARKGFESFLGPVEIPGVVGVGVHPR